MFIKLWAPYQIFDFIKQKCVLNRMYRVVEKTNLIAHIFGKLSLPVISSSHAIIWEIGGGPWCGRTRVVSSLPPREAHKLRVRRVLSWRTDGRCCHMPTCRRCTLKLLLAFSALFTKLPVSRAFANFLQGLLRTTGAETRKKYVCVLPYALNS